MLHFYALNNFNKAFRALANKGVGRRRWLCGKYVEHLCHIEDSEMPQKLRGEFARFKQDMKGIQENCRAESLRLAIHAMDDDQVNVIVARILAMHEVLVHEASLDLLSHKIEA